MNRSLEEYVVDISAEFGWGPAEVLTHLCDLISNSEMSDEAIAWLWHCGMVEKENLLRTEISTENDTENFLADQYDQDFPQNYEVDEP